MLDHIGRDQLIGQIDMALVNDLLNNLHDNGLARDHSRVHLRACRQACRVQTQNEKKKVSAVRRKMNQNTAVRVLHVIVSLGAGDQA